MIRKHYRRPLCASVAWALIFGQILISIPSEAFGSAVGQNKKATPEKVAVKAPEKVAVNRKVPAFDHAPAFPKFSESPGDREFL